MQQEYTFETEDEKEFTVLFDVTITDDGIGAYEFWGSRYFDKGEPYAELDWDDKALTEEQSAIVQRDLEEASKHILEVAMDI